MAKKKNQDWKFVKMDGVSRVSIESGKDIINLSKLDRKLWTVLSCPVKGLEFSEKTLELLDADKDGRIRSDEVASAAGWLGKVLKDPDKILLGEDNLPLSEFNVDDPEGYALQQSAKEILSNLGLEKDSISIADVSDSVAIFANTRFNGDGVITEATATKDEVKETMKACISCLGSVKDRSGADGVNEEIVEKFYKACADYSAWKEAVVLPYEDKTEDAFAAFEALSGKVADYFVRCKLAGFKTDSIGVLGVSNDNIGAISGENLAESIDKIAAFPLAAINPECTLAFAGINPAWKAQFDKLKAIAFAPDAESVSEEEWNAVGEKLAPYKAWKEAKAGSEVEGLGLEAVEDILRKDLKNDFLALIAEDKAVKEEADSIDNVCKLMYLYRYFYSFVRNYVSFTDFYTHEKAIFQAGTLYLDQRSCDLCVRISDMGKQADLSSLGGMYIVYCNCTSPAKGETMTIAAVITDGDVNGLREGKNAVFYDRDGVDWDATIVKIIENPISVRQAFWSPYRKVARFVEDKISKSAADKDAEMTSNLIAKADGEGKAQPFDIGKFAGIFAAVGLAVGAITAGLGVIVKEVAKLQWWGVLIVIAAILLLISGPAMISAWLKLRKRNLAPLLNANGWAINSALPLKVKFGATFTSLASYPKVGTPDISLKEKKKNGWIWSIIVILILAAAAFCYWKFFC